MSSTDKQDDAAPRGDTVYNISIPQGSSIAIGDGAQVGAQNVGIRGAGVANRRDLPRVCVVYCPKDTVAIDAWEHLKASLNTIFELRPLSIGDVWERDLFLEVGRVHAALLLISPTIFDHPTFKIATGLLAARALRQDLKSLIPILLDVSSDTLRGEMDEEWSLPNFFEIFSPLVENNDALIDAVKTRLGQLTGIYLPQTSLEKLEFGIVALIEQVDEQAVINAAAQLGMAIEQGLAGVALRALLARSLWYTKVKLWGLVLAELTARCHIDTSSLIEWILPSWVDPYSAHWLVAAAEQGRRSYAVLVNGQDANFVSESLLRRAYYLPPHSSGTYPTQHPPVVVVDPIADGAPAAVHVQRIREAIKASVLHERFLEDDYFEEDVQAELDKWPIFVVIPPPAPDIDFLEELLSEFPWPRFTFLLLTSDPTEQGGSKESAPLPSTVLVAHPPLRHREERRARREYYHLRSNTLTP